MQGRKPAGKPEIEVLVEPGGPRDSQLAASLATHQSVHGRQVADHGVDRQGAKHLEPLQSVVHFHQLRVRQLVANDSGHGPRGDDRNSSAADRLKTRRVGGIRPRDDDHRHGCVGACGYQVGTGFQLAEGARYQVDVTTRHERLGICRPTARHIDELDAQHSLKVGKVIDRQPVQLALRVLRGKWQLQGGYGVPDRSVAIEDFEFHSRTYEAVVRLFLLPRQPFVPQVFHDGIGNQRQPPIQFMDHVGGSNRRGETKYGATQIEAPQADQVVVRALFQRSVEPGGRSDVDVRLAFGQGLHGLCDSIQLDQPHARIRLRHRLHPRTSTDHDGRGAAEKARVESTLITLSGHDQGAAFQVAGGIHQAVCIFGQRNSAEHQVRFAPARGTHRLVPARISTQFDSSPRSSQQLGEEFSAEAGQLAVPYVFEGIAALEHGHHKPRGQSGIRYNRGAKGDLNGYRQQHGSRHTTRNHMPAAMQTPLPYDCAHRQYLEWRGLGRNAKLRCPGSRLFAP
ncbi:hypothetical protein D3C78_681130 [compost metagenome]